MKRRPATSFRYKPTVAERRAAAVTCATMNAKATPEMLMRSYGMSSAEANKIIEEARRHRERPA